MGVKNTGKPYEGQPWYRDGGGAQPRLELTEKQKAFIEWLVDPSAAKGTQGKWCEDNGVSVRTATSWKKHKLFKEEWEKRAYEIYGGPERVAMVVDALFLAATVGADVKAMQLYLQFVDKFTPKREVVNTDRKEIADLSDAELAALADNITVLRQRSA